MRLLRGHTGVVLALAYSADGRTLASAGSAGDVRLWDLASGATKHVLQRGDGCVTHLAFLAQTPLLALCAVGGHTDLIEIWDTTTGQLTYTLPPLAWTDGYHPIGMIVDGTGTTLALYRADGVLVRYPLPLPSAQEPLLDRVGPLVDLAYAPDVSALLVAQGRRVRVWRGPDLAVSGELWHPTGVAFLAVGRHNRVAVAVGATAYLWDFRARKVRARWEHDEAVVALAVAPDGQVLSGTHAGVVYVWHPERAEPLTAFDWELGPVALLAASPDGMTAAVAAGSDLLVWDREG